MFVIIIYLFNSPPSRPPFLLIYCLGRADISDAKNVGHQTTRRRSRSFRTNDGAALPPQQSVSSARCIYYVKEIRRKKQSLQTRTRNLVDTRVKSNFPNGFERINKRPVEKN